MKVSVGVSNRHVHLTEETYAKLFGEIPMTVRNNLKQPFEYATNSVVSIKSEYGQIERVRVIGPARKYNQVEILTSDIYELKVNAPVCKSGDLENAGQITLIGSSGEVTLENALIVANRHVHMSPEEADRLGLKEDSVVYLKIENDKSGRIEANVKITEKALLEIHLDLDDANAFRLQNGDEIEMEI